jgi:tight adherence protein C
VSGIGAADMLAASAGALAFAGILLLFDQTLRGRLGMRRDRMGALVRAWLARAAAGGPTRLLLARLGGPGEVPRAHGRSWTAAKVGVGLAGALLALAYAPAAPGRTAPLLLAAGAVGGFLAPDLLLARARRRRIDEAVRDLPDMLDLLRVAVEAGMAPARAMANVASEFSGPLAQEWRSVAGEVALGRSEEEALSGLAERLPVDEIVSFVDGVTRSRRHGVPLGRALQAQATRARHQRAQRVRERAARAGPKIQLVVALLLVPSVLLIVCAGIVAELSTTGFGFGG